MFVAGHCVAHVVGAVVVVFEVEVGIITGTFVVWAQALRLKSLELLDALDPDRDRVIRMCHETVVRKVPMRMTRKDAMEKEETERGQSRE